MCSLILWFRPSHPSWPVLIAANRDEMADRPWLPPARHWPDRPNIIAGLDELAGGSWLGINDEGVVAGVLNREGSLGPQDDKRSRGELVLEALDHADAVDAAFALQALNPVAYRTFNLIVADNRDAFWICHADESGREKITVTPIPSGLHMITSRDLNDTASPRIQRYRPLFESGVPDVDQGDWSAWEHLLDSRDSDTGLRGAMRVETDTGFQTSSSSLIALPAMGRQKVKPVWRFRDIRTADGWTDIIV